MAIHIGRRARPAGPGSSWRASASSCPRSLIVGALAWAYVRFGALPEAGGLLYGVKPVIIADRRSRRSSSLGRPRREAAQLRRSSAPSRSRRRCSACTSCVGPVRGRRLARGRAAQPRGAGRPAARRRGSAAARSRSRGRRGRRGRAPFGLAPLFLVLPQGRLGAVRQRLRAARLPARRPRRAAAAG